MHPNEYVYLAYPRHVGRVKAIAAIDKAVKRIVKEKRCTPLEAQRWLFRATVMYANSPAGTNPEKTFIPLPATWYNQGRYEDDPKEWEVVYGANRSTLGNRKADDANAALNAVLARIEQEKEDCDRARNVFSGSRGSNGSGQTGKLLEGTHGNLYE